MRTSTGAAVPAEDRAAVARAVPAEDRAAVARAVLRRAEERTGASRWVHPQHGTGNLGGAVRPAADAVLLDVPGRSPAQGPAELPTENPAEAPTENPARGQVHTPVHGLVPAQQAEPEAEARRLPVPEELATLLPSGGLDRGSTVVVAGSTSLVLALLTEASRSGSWVALVGLPGAGVLAAHQLGLQLDRVALVPTPGPDGPTVVAALLDGVDVVVVGPQAGLSDADRRRLSARARERSAVVLATTPWPGANVVLTAQGSRWEGLGRGEGRLRSRRLTVQRTGRGTAAHLRTAEVVLPAGSHPSSGAKVARPVPPGPATEPMELGLWSDQRSDAPSDVRRAG